MEDILYNLRLTTVMKNQVLKDVSDIFEHSSKGEERDELAQSIASCTLALLLLSRRCGIGMDELNEHMLSRINTGIADGHICETRFSDLSAIAKYIRSD